jgi:hypothetical protein
MGATGAARPRGISRLRPIRVLGFPGSANSDAVALRPPSTWHAGRAVARSQSSLRFAMIHFFPIRFTRAAAAGVRGPTDWNY